MIINKITPTTAFPPATQLPKVSIIFPASPLDSINLVEARFNPFFEKFTKIVQNMSKITALESKPINEDERTDSIISLIEESKSVENIEAQFHFIVLLVSFNKALNNQLETAFSLLQLLPLIPADNVEIDLQKYPDYPSLGYKAKVGRDFHRECLLEAVDLLIKAGFEEFALPLLDRLEQECILKCQHIELYPQVMRLQATLYENIAKKQRQFSNYFLVSFGEDFSPTFAQRSFIYRRDPSYELSNFVSDLQLHYSKAKVLQKISPNLDPSVKTSNLIKNASSNSSGSNTNLTSRPPPPQKTGPRNSILSRVALYEGGGNASSDHFELKGRTNTDSSKKRPFSTDKITPPHPPAGANNNDNNSILKGEKELEKGKEIEDNNGKEIYIVQVFPAFEEQTKNELFFPDYKMASFLYDYLPHNRPQFFRYENIEGSSDDMTINLMFFQIKKEETFPTIRRRADIIPNYVKKMTQKPIASANYMVMKNTHELAMSLWRLNSNKNPSKVGLMSLSSMANGLAQSGQSGDTFAVAKKFLDEEYKKANSVDRVQIDKLRHSIEEQINSLNETLQFIEKNLPEQKEGLQKALDEMKKNLAPFAKTGYVAPDPNAK